MALVVFLKGVNVGGHRRLRPSVVAARLRKYGVTSLGAAGTFLVRKPVGRTRLRAEIRRWLPFDCEVILCDGRELLAAAANPPFAEKPASPDIVRFVAVLAKRPRPAVAAPLRVPGSGRWLVKIVAARGRFLLGVHRREMKVIRQLDEIGRRHGAPAAIRGWNTIRAVVESLTR